VNARVLGPLGVALETAAGDTGTSDAGARSSDGSAIVQAASSASAYLRGLNDLSGEEQGQVRLLLELLGASRQYGTAFGALDPGDSASQAALDQASTVVRSTSARLRRELPSELRVPSDAAYISSAAIAPPPPPPPPVATEPSAAEYVQQVDALLRRSRPVVLALRSFIPRASSDAISRPAAVAAARSYLAQRQAELSRAQTLEAPPAFAPAQALLVRALRVSVQDDQALVTWTIARRDGTSAQAAFAQANQLGAQATALKKQFLRAYGQARQQATGQSPASLPTIF
jgi:hypothetical protein